jgi:hypothetical protein
MDAHASVMALAASCLVWSLIDPQSRPFLKGVQMPNYSPELIHTMRAALDEVITKIPLEQATPGVKAALAQFILKAAANGQTSYDGHSHFLDSRLCLADEGADAPAGQSRRQGFRLALRSGRRPSY